MNTTRPVLFDIKRYAIHDGPHIRTTVFMKGCPLSCWWCHNPEGISPEIELVTDFSKCIGCRECLEACQNGALHLENRKIVKSTASCLQCYECLEICPALVYETTGWVSSTERVMREIEKDIPFFDQAGGGVTFSGGEPLMQLVPLIELLDACGKQNIHRVVDTSAFAEPDDLLKVAALTDLFLIDLKLMDDDAHQRYTGVSNKIILENIQMLAERGYNMTIRVPLIPTINDTRENMLLVAKFIQSLATNITVELLAYHSAAKAKYHKLKLSYAGESLPPLPGDALQKNVSLLQEHGINAQAG